MKRIFALALILCLCLSIFASCGKKRPANTTAAANDGACAHEWGEEVVEVQATCSTPGLKCRYCKKCEAQDPDSLVEIPMLAHTPAAGYVIDLEPTCQTTGLQHQICTVCGKKIPNSDDVIAADPDAHVVNNWTGVFPSLLVADGYRDGTCAICEKPFHEELHYELTVYDSSKLSGPYAEGSAIVISKSIKDARGDKHFYPTSDDDDGNDLWFEYSFLWNPSLENYTGNTHVKAISFRNVSGAFKDFYLLYTRDGVATDCPYKGHIDFTTYFPTTPSTACVEELDNGGPRYLGGWAAEKPIPRTASPCLYDEESQTQSGWHRIGFRFHQEAAIEQGAVVYTGFSELFIDGVKVWKVRTNMQGGKKNDGSWADSDNKSLKNNNLLLKFVEHRLRRL